LKSEVNHLKVTLKTCKREKKEEEIVLEKKHEAVCSEKKNLKSENEDLKSEVNHLKVTLKTCKKEKKESDNRYEKKMHEYEGKISNLIDYKNSKLSKEKDLKSKNKKVEKKLKALVEKEAKVELEKRKVERLLGSLVHEIASKKTPSTTDLSSNLEQSGSVQESPKPKSNQSLPPDQPSTLSGSRAPSSPCTEKTPNAYESSSKLVKAGLQKKLGELKSDQG
jgi:chromosome segregation ATPase